MPLPYVRLHPRPSRLRRSTRGYNYLAAPPLPKNIHSLPTLPTRVGRVGRVGKVDGIGTNFVGTRRAAFALAPTT